MLGITLYGGHGLSYRDAVDLARLAEACGFDAVFAVETFVTDGMAPDASSRPFTRADLISTAKLRRADGQMPAGVGQLGAFRRSATARP
jgi:alkanesulfonate monooxygenase SsuD/methylene tetrahydromethanopterin reductase-like flavin-dependent oxidoreductase (luciferase family)